MKKMNNLFLTTLTVAFLFTSCTKKENKDTTTAQDNALAESMFDDVFKNVNEVAVKEEGANKMGYPVEYTFGASCGSVTLTPLDTTFPKTLTIDFGTTNCSGNDGRNRRGKIIATLSGKYKNTGTVLSVTLDNYHVDDHHIEGTKSVTNAGNNTWNVSVTGGKVTYPNGEVATWASTRTRKWVEGFNTAVSLNKADSACFVNLQCLLDDAYEISGSANGVARNGKKYDVSITTALRVQFCGLVPEVTKGVVEIQPEGVLLRTVDFGNGICDNEGTVTIKKKTYTFKLRGN